MIVVSIVSRRKEGLKDHKNSVSHKWKDDSPKDPVRGNNASHNRKEEWSNDRSNPVNAASKVRRTPHGEEAMRKVRDKAAIMEVEKVTANVAGFK